MTWWMVAIIIGVPSLFLAGERLIAWSMWLRHSREIAKLYGVEGMKALPPIANAFPMSSGSPSPRDPTLPPPAPPPPDDPNG